jgi:S-adenosylmethionine-diacylgycerolhomoserine-N-methlytransferase
MTAKDHGALMDDVYRYQRYIYDASRKFYLLGRDRLIDALAPSESMHILEVGCGTGRNLIQTAHAYPHVQLYGVDISHAMLKTAHQQVSRAGLTQRIRLAQADARDFDPESLFGHAQFDRVFFSFSLSMIPEWTEALRQGLQSTADTGRLHVVDFGQQERLPGWARGCLGTWLKWFHVHPDPKLIEMMQSEATLDDRPMDVQSLYRDYTWLVQIGAKRTQ